MGLWKQHFHWRILLDWVVLAWALPTGLAIAGLLLAFDQYKGANLCFILVAVFIFAKIAYIAIAAPDPTWQRLLFTFVLFGAVGVGIVETVKGVNRWRDVKAASPNGTIQPTNATAHPSLPPGVSPPAQPADASQPSLVLPASPVQTPPLRRPMDAQTTMLRSWIRQTMDRTSAREMWLSQIFQSILDGIPGGPDIDVPQALRQLASEGEVEILETTARTYRTWWGELFNEDIRFRVKTLSQ